MNPFRTGKLFRALVQLQTPSISVRFKSRIVEKPKAPKGEAQYRRIVLYPEEYTVKPLNVQNLGGRDPVTGRVVAKGIGGGIKHKYHWIDWYRRGPTDDSPPIVSSSLSVTNYHCRNTKFWSKNFCDENTSLKKCFMFKQVLKIKFLI